MGADCCGGGPPDVASLSLNATARSPAKATAPPAAPAKPHADYAADLKAYVARRIELFEGYRAREVAKVEAAKAAAVPIEVTLPDGTVKPGVAGVTTPLEIAVSLSKSLAKAAVVAKVDGETWDLTRPLTASCALHILTFDADDGRDAFWHSSAHVLGEALEQKFGVKLTIGPPVDEGFYYDCYMDGGRTLSEADFGEIDAEIAAIVKQAQPFERAVVSRAEALAMFSENKFKLEIINGLPADAVISLYRCGPMVDLCHGPHVPHTGYLKAAKTTQASAAFWRGDAKNEALQRVYGVTFPDKASLADYEHRMAEAKRRDHRMLGTAHDLTLFHPLSPGSAFFMPAGARIYNALVDYVRGLYWEHEFDEVVTPNLYNFDLWKTSGHAAHYKENMFCVDVEKQEFGLKPMNCPGHCLLYGARARSYRDLPIRMADFGVLHRNEYSGALSGLTRVRRFQQDDAHIFCRADQVGAEVGLCLAMLAQAYGVLGLDYKLALSTRPDSYLGEPSPWDAAEGALKDALDGCGRPWEENPGDGAFYGPKIDVTVTDALKRRFQCATIQLDFQLPIRFGLTYATGEAAAAAGDDAATAAPPADGAPLPPGVERPVIVHRAILGSVERMFAILTEHYAGKWPLWLSPRQVMVVPIAAASLPYARRVRSALRSARFHAEVDAADKKMQKKVREAQLAQYNYILVVGADEEAAGTVNVRTRDNKVFGQRDLADVVALLTRERDERALGSVAGNVFGEGVAHGRKDGKTAVEEKAAA